MKIKLLTITTVIILLICSSYDINALGVHDNIGKGEEQNNPKYVIDNPYQSVDWNKAKQIRSTTHIHITDQIGLNKASELGYLHLPVSNYYPSAPYYPIDQIRENQFRVKQDFGVVRVLDGEEPQYIEGPIDWNQIIMDEETGWVDSLPKEMQLQLPFKLGDFIYKDIPNNIIFSPNAEHHSFANVSGNVHINAPGSLYSSGTFDARNRFKTYYGDDGAGYSYGVGLTWQDSFKKMFDQLLFEDGGGVTINHPTWSKIEQSLIEEMLDFDPRVLGIEVLCQGTWDLEMWDNVLKTGRRCLGFFVPDWGVQVDEVYKGFNVLLMNDFTEHNCLKAYREGAFFGSENGGDLIFNEISLINDQLMVETNSTSTITIVTDSGISKIEPDVTHTLYTIPSDRDNTPTIKYVRVEAENEEERIFSQPIRFIIR